jgi:tRNA threonylcarbamoyladenosine biosynthesis protein TsaE
MSISRSPQETEALAAAWSGQAQAGLVIGLIGDLGAGKTHWARGLARGLGFRGRVHSPTFALLNAYKGARLPIYHVDLYRLETPEQVALAGLEEYLPSADGVTLVEWMERWLPEATGPAGAAPLPCPPRLWVVRFGLIDDQQREIVHEDISR